MSALETGALRRAEQAIVRALNDAGFGQQSQVTRSDSFDIAVDGVVVRVAALAEGDYGDTEEMIRWLQQVRDRAHWLHVHRRHRVAEYIEQNAELGLRMARALRGQIARGESR